KTIKSSSSHTKYLDNCLSGSKVKFSPPRSMALTFLDQLISKGGIMPVLDLPTLTKDLGNARWRARQTPHSQLNDTQKKALLGVVVDQASLASAMSHAAVAAAPAPAFAPAVDWRSRNGNHVTSVKDQRNCGSCVSFCTTGVTESMASIEKGE